ncbi:MAG TPA: AgmX/PglI C-terminal domain-containing protein [Polyangia bacterium]|nr:AgmX/PglI C-terminal domain-containing protein [Polyangia bacterium]
MQHLDPRRDRLPGVPVPPPAGSPSHGTDPPRDGASPGSATISLAAPALLVEARFRDITLAARLLRADRPGRFTVGPGRGADAPVNPAWLTAAEDQPPHPLVERTPAGFAVSLTPAMGAQLWTAHQRLPLRPDAGRPEAPLELPPDAHLRIPCGEMVFELRAAEIPGTVPRPWLPPGWRAGLRYPAGVAVALLAVMSVVRWMPPDPRALSLDVFGADRRLDRTVVIPLDVAAPAVEKAREAARSPAGGSRAASGPSGQAGSPRAPRRETRLAVAGTARTDARQAAAAVRSSGVLSLLDGPRSAAVADVFDTGPAIGGDARDAIGHLEGVDIAAAYGLNGLGRLGTGAGAAGTGDRTIGDGAIDTLGRFGHRPGSGAGSGYGSTAGSLGTRKPHPPDILIGSASVRGSLDKEIIRRIVRQHLNEVRYCYVNALAAHPTLAGRVVVQFTIAPTGSVLAAVLSSSTLGNLAVESCVVGAVRRWEFPQPQGGGLASVTYPFQLSPAGQ